MLRLTLETVLSLADCIDCNMDCNPNKILAMDKWTHCGCCVGIEIPKRRELESKKQNFNLYEKVDEIEHLRRKTVKE